MSSPFQQAHLRVQAGFAAQERGELAAADDEYRAALLLVAEHPTALQLLGLLARRRGDDSAAEDLMRRSLKTFPKQPHVWNNLGNLLLDTGRPDEGLASFEQALQLDTRYADAHYNCARALLALGRHADAEASLRAALDCRVAGTTGELQLLAQIQAERGELDAAMRTIDSALQVAPDHPGLLHNRATLLQRRHRPREALAAHQRALALGLDAADAHYNLGNTLQSLGQLEAAADAYRAALQRQPLHELALVDLARLRWRQGDADFDAGLRAATRQFPASPLGPQWHAQMLMRIGRFDAAAAAYLEATRRAPLLAASHEGLSRCLVRLGDVAAAVASCERALQLAPGHAGLQANAAATLLIARQPERAEALAARACAQAPADSFAWAVRGLCWRVLGDAREAWLNDYARCVHVVDLPPPPGFADMANFNAALAHELLALHADSQAPLDQTLRHGTQTMGDIFEQGHPLVDALKQLITQAVQETLAGLPVDGGHPFLGMKPAAWRYADSWSSRLRDSGFHTNHVHPHGWLSSAYYVAVPACCDDADRRPGWLHFGAPDFDCGITDAERAHVQPRPGRLVLFPSMFWHGTVPFHSQTERLTVAFDVVPA